MNECRICPRECGADRGTHPGYCGAWNRAHIARAALHFWEEPPISGTRGSGAVFFSGCNLSCVFCQNYQINHAMVGKETDAQGLADWMLNLQAQGAHNINLVTPAPHVPLLLHAIPLAKKMGLAIPIVYNTNAYEKVENLRALDGLVDVYLPDLKYVSSAISQKYSGAPDYFAFAAPAVGEMFRQCGLLTLDEQGIARRGVIVRHLVLPGSVDETRRVLNYLAGVYPRELTISLMSQYAPISRQLPKPLDRKLLKREYDRAVEHCILCGFENVFTQKTASATLDYTPEFHGIVI
jgi:putative pyruvate formate lyase activating enzyme